MDAVCEQAATEQNRAFGVRPMEWNVTEVRVIDENLLCVRFADGTQGRVRFRQSFFSGVFAPLKDRLKFREVRVEHGFITWPGELDLAPDAMYAEIKKHHEMVLE
jgi:hypothetical protein